MRNLVDKANLPEQIVPKSKRFKDITGQKFGHLTALYPAGYLEKSQRLAWLCKCDCSQENYLLVSTSNLTGGSVQSCGCIKRGNKVQSAATKDLIEDTIENCSAGSDSLIEDSSAAAPPDGRAANKVEEKEVIKVEEKAVEEVRKEEIKVTKEENPITKEEIKTTKNENPNPNSLFMPPPNPIIKPHTNSTAALQIKRNLNLPYTYNLVYYIETSALWLEDFEPHSLIQFSILDKTVNDLDGRYLALSNYTLDINKYKVIDGEPFNSFTKSKDFTFTKKELEEIDNNFPANDAWKAPFIERHLKINLSNEVLEKLRSINIKTATNEIINKLIENEILIPKPSGLYVIDLRRKGKTKYYLEKRLEQRMCSYNLHKTIERELVFTDYNEAYSYAAMLYCNSLRRREELARIDRNETIEWVVKQIPSKDRDELRLRLNLLPINQNEHILCLKGEVFYHTQNSPICYQLYPFDKTLTPIPYAADLCNRGSVPIK